MSKVLVLNATYEPISFVSIKRAVVLLLKEKAEVIEASVERKLRAERIAYPYPLVIRLVTYVPVPRFFNLPLTRRSLLSRDNYTCQYCGSTENSLTMDHVIPRSRGGKTEWTNVVAACVACNRKKGNKMPVDAKMIPRIAPVKPGYIAVVLLGQAKGNETWARYIQPTMK
jgi:5-methylcytosine-specific restriction endonuclease McrA